MLAAAREAGAHDLFVMVAAVDPDAVEVGRNYVANEVVRAYSEADEDEWAEHLDRRVDRAGDFVRSLWDGDLAEALYHADGTNSRLLIRLLADDVIMSALIEERGSYESAHSWYEPNRQRYGWEGSDTFNRD